MNRKFDDLGRIVIPKEMRNKLGFGNRDEANIELVDDKIVITNMNKNNNDWQQRVDRAIDCLEELIPIDNDTMFLTKRWKNHIVSVLKGDE